MTTPKQIAALKYLIFKQGNICNPSKQVLVFLLDQSSGLEEEVCVTVTEDHDGYNADEINLLAHHVGCMQSVNGTLHLNEVMQAMGTDFIFSLHYGDFDPNRPGDKFSSAGQFAGGHRHQVLDPSSIQEGMPMRYTFWLSRTAYTSESRFVQVSRKQLERIDTTKPGLYPSLEED